MKKLASKLIILDTWAMIAYLHSEPAAREVRQALRRARKREVLVLFSLINYGECMYIVERERGIEEAEHAANVIDQLALEVVSVDRPLVFAAAHLKARYPISYADAFAAALAKRNRGRLMTGDPEFKAVEREIAIHWLLARRR
ncbi:MAG: type II toxin-antitoxin system VapC family toxin [Acidobacteria bacterium]|nr:type II toxin-antitoxin system VapC family toxin [Acidobacteriota bacterium]